MYQELVNDMFLERYEERPPDGRLHPSSLSGCERQAVYVATGTPVSDSKDIRNIRIMGTGTAIHEIVQEEVKKAHPGFLTEVDIDWGPVKGSADGLLPIGEGLHPDAPRITDLSTVYELQEYKSISPNGKRFLKGDPKPEHVLQARMYYWALDNQGYLLDGIRIVYFDRDDWSVLEFEVAPWDEQEQEAFEDRLAALEAHIMDGTLPPQMPDDYWLCRFCDYRTLCKGGA